MLLWLAVILLFKLLYFECAEWTSAFYVCIICCVIISSCFFFSRSVDHIPNMLLFCSVTGRGAGCRRVQTLADTEILIHMPFKARTFPSLLAYFRFLE
jgi:hypothetical protein